MTIIIVIISILIGVLISFLQYEIYRRKRKKVKELWISCREDIDNVIKTIENKRGCNKKD